MDDQSCSSHPAAAASQPSSELSHAAATQPSSEIVNQMHSALEMALPRPCLLSEADTLSIDSGSIHEYEYSSKVTSSLSSTVLTSFQIYVPMTIRVLLNSLITVVDSRSSSGFRQTEISIYTSDRFQEGEPKPSLPIAKMNIIYNNQGYDGWPHLPVFIIKAMRKLSELRIEYWRHYQKVLGDEAAYNDGCCYLTQCDKQLELCEYRLSIAVKESFLQASAMTQLEIQRQNAKELLSKSNRVHPGGSDEIDDLTNHLSSLKEAIEKRQMEAYEEKQALQKLYDETQYYRKEREKGVVTLLEQRQNLIEAARRGIQLKDQLKHTKEWNKQHAMPHINNIWKMAELRMSKENILVKRKKLESDQCPENSPTIENPKHNKKMANSDEEKPKKNKKTQKVDKKLKKMKKDNRSRPTVPCSIPPLFNPNSFSTPLIAPYPCSQSGGAASEPAEAMTPVTRSLMPAPMGQMQSMAMFPRMPTAIPSISTSNVDGGNANPNTSLSTTPHLHTRAFVIRNKRGWN